MQKPFQEILNQLIQEQGPGVLDRRAQCRGLLYDYAKGKYKREIRLFLQSLEAGYHRKLLKAAELRTHQPKAQIAVPIGRGIAAPER